MGESSGMSGNGGGSCISVGCLGGSTWRYQGTSDGSLLVVVVVVVVVALLLSRFDEEMDPSSSSL